MTFCSMSSRPVTLMGLPKDTLDELIGSLLETVHRYFQTCDSPENYLVRGLPSTVETITGEQRVILLGASNLGRCAGRLRQLGKTVKGLIVVTIRNALILFYNYYFVSFLVTTQTFLVIIRSH
jgi:hypothetical protein